MDGGERVDAVRRPLQFAAEPAHDRNKRHQRIGDLDKRLVAERHRRRHDGRGGGTGNELGGVPVAFKEGDVACLRFTDRPGRLDGTMAVAVDRAVDQLRQLSDGDAHGRALSSLKAPHGRTASAPADGPAS